MPSRRARFKLAQRPPLQPVIEEHPQNQRPDHERGSAVGGRDEGHVGVEIHGSPGLIVCGDEYSQRAHASPQQFVPHRA